MKLSDFVFDFIASKEIDTVFTVSGGGCMHLIDSLGKNNKIKYICNHHEQACAIAAEGYSRMKNKPGCVLVTTGPGGTNALTGVLCAYQDSIPIIIISGQVPTEQLSRGTGCRQIGQQEFNIVDTVKPMTKYSKVILDKNSILYELQKAYHICTTGRPGPVWIDIPLDIQSSEIQIDILEKFYPEEENGIINSIKNKYYLTKFKKLLNKAKKPIIVVGGGIYGSATKNELVDFLNRTEIPVMTGPHSAVDLVNTDYKYYAGRFGLLGQYTSNQLIQDSDLIISFGSRLNPKMIGYDSNKFAPKATKFVIDVDYNEIKKLKFKNKIGWNIDLKHFFKLIKSCELNPNIDTWKKSVLEFRDKEILVLPKHRNLDLYTSTYVFAETLQKYLDDDSVVVTSDGTAHVIPLKTMMLRKNQRLFSNEGTAPMGYGLPAAIGAYFAANKKIICIEGDGSIMMNLQELETVRYHKIPMILIIINNEGYLSIKLTQKSFFKGNLVASDVSSGISIPEFKKISDVFNFKYYCIKNNSEIDSVLKNAISESGPIIIEIFADPNEQHEPKVIARGIDRDGKVIPGELTDMNIKF
jgi:acetolactate synthase-1/2/3 large subunit